MTKDEALRPPGWQITISIDGPGGIAIQSCEVPDTETQVHGFDALADQAHGVVDDLVNVFRLNEAEADGEYVR